MYYGAAQRGQNIYEFAFEFFTICWIKFLKDLSV